MQVPANETHDDRSVPGEADKQFRGRVALVTGAARGQGAVHCRGLARRGASIVALDLCQDIPGFYELATKSELDETVESCRALGAQAIGVVADVRDRSAIGAAVEEALARFGQVDLVCNNAGVARLDAVEEMSEAVLDGVIDANVKGVFHVVHAVVPTMKERRYGRIVNIASAAAVQPLAHLSHYSASKAAVVAATKSWARELGPWDITVNCVAPGTIKTPMIAGLGAQLGKDLDDAFEQFNHGNVFVGDRAVVTPEDIAGAVRFFFGEESRAITGRVLVVDGGKTAASG